MTNVNSSKRTVRAGSTSDQVRAGLDLALWIVIASVAVAASYVAPWLARWGVEVVLSAIGIGW